MKSFYQKMIIKACKSERIIVLLQSANDVALLLNYTAMALVAIALFFHRIAVPAALVCALGAILQEAISKFSEDMTKWSDRHD